MSTRIEILHETARRLRVVAPETIDLDALPADLRAIAGVRSARVNRRLRCVAIEYDGDATVRRCVLRRLQRGHASARSQSSSIMPRSAAAASPAGAWGTAAAAAAVPLLPRDWRAGAALGMVALRVVTQPGRLRADPVAVVLDAASLVALALGGQAPVASTSVLLRLLAERLSSRFVREVDELLAHLLPTEAEQYRALRDPADRDGWWPLRRLRAGDRIRLFPGDIVPVDGTVSDGRAELAPVLPGMARRSVQDGDTVAAGERLHEGTLEIRAEADAAHSRLERLRTQLRHALAARDPVGRLTPPGPRLLTLPLTAAALVLGFTGDSARAAAMLQADPQQGLDLTQPVAREAALLALARSGLVTSGLEVVSRLATARTLVVQDSGVLATGRWTVESISVERGGDAAQVRRWLARWAGLAATAARGDATRKRRGKAAPAADAATALSFPDRLVRDWYRHGAIARSRDREVHLVSRETLAAVWGLGLPASRPSRDGLLREFACVTDGRVVARVVLTSRWRPAWRDHLVALRSAGFERIALVAEIDGGAVARSDGTPDVEGSHWLPSDPAARSDWLADATADGSAAVVVHTQLRDLIPPGSLGLAPLAAEVGPHGVLVGDPLGSLLAARRVAQTVDQRLRRHQAVAAGGNAVLMTAAALRVWPPMATALLHHALALLMLLDSWRIENLGDRVPPEVPHAEPAEGATSSAPVAIEVSAAALAAG